MGKRVECLPGMRPVNTNDFNESIWLNAIYGGSSTYLEHGKAYNIQIVARKNKVSVPKCLNPRMDCNYGTEFAMGAFFVPEERTA